MAKSYHIFLWKKAPFLRLLVPVIAGILIEYYFKVKIPVTIAIGLLSITLLFVFSFFREAARYSFRWLQGVMISVFLIAFGSCITWQKDIRNHQNWYGKSCDDSTLLVVRLIEPPVEKEKSYKALASVESCINNNSSTITDGKLVVYFAKDSFSKGLQYGDKIIIGKGLKNIKNSGNPAGFNYVQYMAFQQIF